MRKLLKILVLLSLCGIVLLCTACTPKWTKDAELINTDSTFQALQDAGYKIEIDNIEIDAKKDRIHIRYKQNAYVYIKFEVSNREGIDF